VRGQVAGPVWTRESGHTVIRLVAFAERVMDALHGNVLGLLAKDLHTSISLPPLLYHKTVWTGSSRNHAVVWYSLEKGT
jgi:hypothetical protein